MALEGQHIVVTGAAQGIGERVARTLADKGAVLYLTDIQSEKVAGVAGELGAASGSVDISDARSADAMIADAIGRLGHIDGLVNIAGIDAPWVDALEEGEDSLAAYHRHRSLRAVVGHPGGVAAHGGAQVRAHRDHELCRRGRRISRSRGLL